MQDIQKVVRQCQDGHLDAFAILFSHYRQDLWNTVDPFDERLRLPLILRYHYGHSCSDIAMILDRRLSTIYQQLHEGRRLLEQKLQQQESSKPAVVELPS